MKKSEGKRYVYRVVSAGQSGQEVEDQPSVYENKPCEAWTLAMAIDYCERKAPERGNEGVTFRILRRPEGVIVGDPWCELRAYVIKVGRARRTDLKRFKVVASLTISVSTDVLARTEKEAMRKANERSPVMLCHQCATGDPNSEWVTSGDLDGAPNNMRIGER